MGKNSSSAFVETNIVNDIITNILMESSQECEVSAATNQKINISNITGVGCSVNISGISQEASITQNFSCINTSDNGAELQSKLKNELDSKVEALTSGQTIGVSQSDAAILTNLKNEVLLNVDMSSIASCVSSALSNQTININNITAVYCRDGQALTIQNIKQKITMDQIIKCTNSNKQTTDAITEFENKVTSVAKAKSEGINMAMAGFSSVSSSFVLVIGLVIIAAIASNTITTLEGDSPGSLEKLAAMSGSMATLNN